MLGWKPRRYIKMHPCIYMDHLCSFPNQVWFPLALGVRRAYGSRLVWIPFQFWLKGILKPVERVLGVWGWFWLYWGDSTRWFWSGGRWTFKGASFSWSPVSNTLCSAGSHLILHLRQSSFMSLNGRNVNIENPPISPVSYRTNLVVG